MKTVWLVILGFAWGVAHASSLPFADSFDSLSAGSLQYQNGWRVVSGTADVQTAVAYSSNAVGLASGIIGHDLSSTNASVWITFYARCSAWPSQNPALSNADTSLAFYINTHGSLTVYSNMVPVDLGVQIETNVWTRFDVYCDYDTQTWNLSVNKTSVAAGLPFYATAQQVAGLRIQNDGTEPAYVDDIDVTDLEPVADPIDGDGDGLPDWWEQKYFGGIFAAQTNSLAANGVNNLLEAYILGLNPTSQERFTVTEVPGSIGSLRWTGHPGRLYDVWSTDDLRSGFVLLQAGIPWDQNEFTDSVYPVVSNRFYRLQVQLDNL